LALTHFFLPLGQPALQHFHVPQSESFLQAPQNEINAGSELEQVELKFMVVQALIDKPAQITSR